MNEKEFQALLITFSVNVRHLKINHFFPPLSQKQCQEITEALNRNVYLKKLSFGNYCLSYNEAEAFSTILANNNTLQTLTLQGNRIGDLGVKYLAKALKKNKTLTHLDLMHCDICTEGAKAIAQALITNQTLKEIYLTGNQITQDGIKAISLALKDNLSITKLILSRTAITILDRNTQLLLPYRSQPTQVFRNKILENKRDQIINIYMEIYQRNNPSSPIFLPKSLSQRLNFICQNANLIEKCKFIALFDKKFYIEYQNYLPTLFEEQIDSILYFVNEQLKEYFIVELSHLISQYLALTFTDKLNIILESRKERTPLTFSHYQQLQRKEKITKNNSCSLL